VIEIFDSDDEATPCHAKRERDMEDVVFVKSIQSSIVGANIPAGKASLGRQAKNDEGEKRKQINNENHYLNFASSQNRKRPRVILSEAAAVGRGTEISSLKTYPIIVNIDKDGCDHSYTIPGRLLPQHEWIHSNDTSKIVQFIGQKDNWSCGYRNLQMLLSALLPHLPRDHGFHSKYPRRDEQITIPSLNQIQSVIESAWREGFDPNGAAHFRYKLQGKKSYIGAVEVYTALAFWGIDATVIQFIRCPESRHQLPRFVQSYFSKALGNETCPFCNNNKKNSATKRMSSATCSSASDLAGRLLSSTSNDSLHPGKMKCRCPPMPLYLQWEGHSVTIAGIDELRGEFLVFNPQHERGPSRLPFTRLIMKDTQILMVPSFHSMDMSEKLLKKSIQEFPIANWSDVKKTIARSS